jgi:hypothetical protein
VCVCVCVYTHTQVGEPSYVKWKEEKDNIYQALLRKSKMVHRKLNSIDGVTCQQVLHKHTHTHNVYIGGCDVCVPENRVANHTHTHTLYIYTYTYTYI